MTAPSPETREREREKLWVNDAELIRRLGVPEKMARAILRELDTKHPGFPKKQKMWGDRRYMPAVQAYLDRVYATLPGDAARLAAEDRVRTRLPRHSPAEPMRRAHDK